MKRTKHKRVFSELSKLKLGLTENKLGLIWTRFSSTHIQPYLKYQEKFYTSGCFSPKPTKCLAHGFVRMPFPYNVGFPVSINRGLHLARRGFLKGFILNIYSLVFLMNLIIHSREQEESINK